jgi:signal transduction histidine kinase
MDDREQSYEIKQTVASVIERGKDDIIERWVRVVQAEAQRRDISVTHLIDGLAQYLERIVAALRQRNAAGPLATAWEDVAREHALTRLRQGFDIEQLVREMVHLRRVITSVLAEQGCLDALAATIVADLLESAITVVVVRYVEARDFRQRRMQAEHVGLLVHELKNPIAAAKLRVNQLHHLGLPSVEHQRAVEVLTRAHDRMLTLIDEVLSFQRVEARVSESRPEDVTLKTILDEEISIAERAATAKGLVFEALVPPDIHVRADRNLVAMATGNLLENAVKYTDTGKIEVVVEEREREVAVHFRDTGPGISTEELAVIFEPYRRGHTNKPGTGLGLAIAKRAVEAQGGRIFAESGLECGCHFVFTLPKADQRSTQR